MKLLTQARQTGSILILTLAVSGIIGITLAAYLSLVDTQNRAVYRSLSWNTAIPSAEAGLEEALSHINSGSNITDNGWTTSGTNVTLSRTIGDVKYTVAVSTNTPYVILTTGYSKKPLSTNEIMRSILVTTTKDGDGFKGLVAKGNVSLGPGSDLDSFDSRLTGAYDSSSGQRDKCYVGSVLGTVSGGTVAGDVATGPSVATPSSLVGDFGWLSTHSSGIQPGHYDNDLNASFPDVEAPFSGGFSMPSGGSVTTTNYTNSISTVTNVTHPGPITATITTNIINNTSTTYPTPAPTSGVLTNSGPVTTTTYPTGFAGSVSTSVVAGSSVTTSAHPGAIGVTITTNTVEKSEHKNNIFPPNPPSFIPGYYSGNDYRLANPQKFWMEISDYTYTPNITNYTYTTTSYEYDTYTYTYDTTVTNVSGTTTDTYDYVFTSSGNYKSASGIGNSKWIIKAGVDAVVWVPSIDMSGQSTIIVEPGGSLSLYIGSDSPGASTVTSKIAGNGIFNQGGDTEKMQIYTFPNVSELKLAGNAGYTGTIYGPNTALKGAGGGVDDLDFVGAAIVGAVDFAGHFSFHYDEKLGELDTGSGLWSIASWNEE